MYYMIPTEYFVGAFLELDIDVFIPGRSNIMNTFSIRPLCTAHFSHATFILIRVLIYQYFFIEIIMLIINLFLFQLLTSIICLFTRFLYTY